MISIPKFVYQFVKKFYTIISILLCLILIIGGAYKYKANINQTKFFVENEIKSRIETSTLNQSTATLSKEINFFCDSIKEGLDINLDATVYQNSKLIAACTNNSNSAIFMAHDFSIRTLDNSSFSVSYRIKLNKILFDSFIPAILGAFILIFIFILASTLIGKSLKLTMYSLEELVQQLNIIRFEKNTAPNKIKMNSSFEEVAAIVNSINDFLIEIGKLNEESKKQEQIAFKARIAFQIAHDIRSPLAALEMISGSLNELPEDKRLIIKNSINRIRDISNSLLDKNRANNNSLVTSQTDVNSENKSEELSTTLLSPLIDSIITEKRLQYRNQLGIRIDFNQSKESYGLFAKIQPNEFQRVLSNLIDNSVEAFTNQQGTIELILQTNKSNNIELVVKDNGKGIPQNILSKLGNRGETHGKSNGSGLGLFHAKETIQTANGSLKIDSKENNGTTICITLPRQIEPKWFVPKIVLKKEQTLIVFDDDQSIHQIWKGRLESITHNGSINLLHFSDPSELRKFYGKNFTDFEDALFLMDYEITNTPESGLDVIEKLGIQKQSILVTSRYEEKNIRERCENLGVRLIPKNMSGFVPMEII